MRGGDENVKCEAREEGEEGEGRGERVGVMEWEKTKRQPTH